MSEQAKAVGVSDKMKAKDYITLAVHCNPNSQGAFLLSLRGWKACKAHGYAGPR